MYMMIDVNSPLQGESLHATEPWTTYTSTYLNRTFAIVEAFKNYPNTLLFFAGNEVIQDLASAKPAPPYVRAVTRDLKNYISKHSSRPIAVGYSAADVREVLFDSWNYFQCAEDGNADDMSRIDVFALNSYSWCGDSTFQNSGYDTLVAGFKGTSVPVFFSEFGCNKPAPRKFTEIAAIYGPQMTPVLSGGVVYEYVQETNNFGLVDLSDQGAANILPDYYTLKDQYAKINFQQVQSVKASTSSASTPPTCAAKLITSSIFSNNFTLPVLPPGAEEILNDGVSPAPVGKIVQISDWKVTVAVHNPDGSELTDLAVKPLADDASNAPGTNNPTSASGTGTASAPSPTASGKNAAADLSSMRLLAVRWGSATTIIVVLLCPFVI